MNKVLGAIALLAMASLAQAASFTKDGPALDGGYGYNYLGDRTLIPDGSFEEGCDAVWTCMSDNTCEWIADLVPLGLWNYDGGKVAWLGGFCGGLATCYSHICQTMDMPWAIQFHWMAYVNDSVSIFTITVDEDIVYSFVPQPSDHLQGYEYEFVSLEYYWGVHELCFSVDNNANCGSNMGDNWFVDYVENGSIGGDDETGVPHAGGAWEALSVSTVKALY